MTSGVATGPRASHSAGQVTPARAPGRRRRGRSCSAVLFSRRRRRAGEHISGPPSRARWATPRNPELPPGRDKLCERSHFLSPSSLASSHPVVVNYVSVHIFYHPVHDGSAHTQLLGDLRVRLRDQVAVVGGGSLADPRRPFDVSDGGGRRCSSPPGFLTRDAEVTPRRRPRQRRADAGRRAEIVVPDVARGVS